MRSTRPGEAARSSSVAASVAGSGSQTTPKSSVTKSVAARGDATLDQVGDADDGGRPEHPDDARSLQDAHGAEDQDADGHQAGEAQAERQAPVPAAPRQVPERRAEDEQKLEHGQRCEAERGRVGGDL